MTGIMNATWAAVDGNSSVFLLVVKATLLLVAAIGVTLVMRRASAGARHLVWLVTLGSLFLIPVLSTWAPVSLAILPASPAAAQPPAPSAVTTLASDEVPASASVRAPSVPSASEGLAPAARAWASPVAIAFWVWLVVALAICALLARAAFVVNRIVRGATPLDDKGWLDPLYEISDRLNLDEAPRLVRSNEAKMPFACGLFRPTIVLPPESEQWSPERRRAVMLHELAHVRRKDLVGHVLGRIACAVYWFHPLVWAAAKRLRSESERACDDIALASGARAPDYAEHLLDIVTSVRHDRTPAVAMAMARRKEFEGRMLAILDPEMPRSSPRRRQAAALVGTFALLAITIGAAVPAQRAAVTDSDVASVQGSEGDEPVLAEPDTDEEGKIIDFDTEDERADEEEQASAVAMAAPKADVGVVVAESIRDAISNTLVRIASPIAAEAPESPVSPALQRLVTTKDSPDERVELLARVLRTDASADLRRIAAWGLNDHTSSAVAVQALVGALQRDASPAVREMAAWALADAEHDGAAISSLATALRGDADPKVRATSAWSLGQVGDASAVPALTLALRDASASVRARAVWGLGIVEPREAPPALVAMLRDSDRDVRLLTAWALHRIEDPSAISGLTAALRAEGDAEVKYAYVRALASTGEQSVDAIRDLLDSPDQRLKSIAVRALAGGKGTGPWPWPWPEPRPFP